MLYNKINLSVAKIASKSGSRPEISGVFFTAKHTVATDSFRLVEISVPADKKPEDVKDAMRGVKPFIASGEMVKDIKLKDNSEVVAIKHLHDNRIEFLVGENIVNVKRIDGEYPDYESIMPTGEPSASVKINAKYLSEVLDILGKLGGASNEVVMKIYGKELQMVVVEAGSDKQKGKGVIMCIAP